MAMKYIQAFALLSTASGAAHMATDCHMADMDVGGGANSCGYMDTIMMVVAEGQAKFSWFEGYYKFVPAEDLAGPAHCQALCEEIPDCMYWAYSPPDPEADCTLKRGYDSDTCTPLYEASTGLTSGPKMCPACMKEEMDVGGGFNACGYMDNVVVYAKHNVSKQSWYKGNYVVLHDVMTWTVDRCHDLCAANPMCSYFHMSEEHCYLKADYTHAQYDAQDCVPLYQAFDVERDFKYTSGPKTCVESSHSVPCGEVKEMYKEGQCCGNPQKMIPMPHAH